MQNRERGAAHINIYFFLVLLVVFLGTLWFGYLQMSKVNEAEKRALEARQDQLTAEMRATFLEHYKEEVASTFGEIGSWTGKKGFNYVERFKSRYEDVYGAGATPPAPKALEGVCVPAQAKSLFQSLAKSLGLNDSSVSPVGAFLGNVKAEHTRLTAAVDKAVSDVQIAQTQTATVTTRFDTEIAAQKNVHTKMQTEYTKNINDQRNANTQVEARRLAALAETKKTNEELAAARLAHADAVKGYQKERDKDHGQLAAYIARDAIRQPPQQADGSVISASMVADRGWIDIGKKDMLSRGTKFRIMNAAGTKVKGHGEVIDLKQDRAELRLTTVSDRIGDPIVRGDQIYNDLYSPNMKRNVAMIGRFSYPYTKPMIRKLLERLGNKVHDDVKVGVDLVIVGLQEPTEEGDALKPVDETPGYKEAQRLHCEIITISKIRDLLQLSDN